MSSFKALERLEYFLYEKLKTWFLTHKRDLPWRRTKDPYAIWVSEIMLQQTQAKTVIPYFERFMKTFPTLESLAHAPEDDLFKAWEGLGYYSRAKNLQKAALYFLEHHQGQIPSNFEALKKAHGIGDYTAGAIASFAFGQKVPAIDGNAVRVLSRLLGKPWSLSKEKDRKACADLVKDLFERHPEIDAALWNEALIELGATVCTPKNPNYELHPWKDFDFAYQTGRLDEFPVTLKKKVSPTEHYQVLCLENEKGEFLVQKRGENQLLAGLWEFPSLSIDLTYQKVQENASPYAKDSIETYIPFVSEQELYLYLSRQTEDTQNPLYLHYKDIAYLGNKKHIFSHKIWQLQFFHIHCEKDQDCFETFFKNSKQVNTEQFQWCSTQELQKLAFSSSQTDLRKSLIQKKK